MNLEPAARFYTAARAAADHTGLAAHMPEVLVRFGLPGLIQRLRMDDALERDPALVRIQGLVHTILREEALRVTAAMRTAGLPHFFAKGIALLGHPYQPGDRLLADIDLYITPDAQERTIRLLESLGYSAVPEHEQAGPAALRSTLTLRREAQAEPEQAVIDLHWALDPVERVLPRRDRPVPERVWNAIATGVELPRPHPEHHAAILVHHLIHTDLLHVRSLLDLAFVFQEFTRDGGSEYVATCDQLRVGRFGIAVARLVADEFGIDRPAATQRDVTRAVPALSLVEWLAVVACSGVDVDNVVTIRRLRRRLALIDRPAYHTLARDVFWPPAAFLRWRWPSLPLWLAGLRHYGQLVRKSASMLPFARSDSMRLSP